MQDETLKNTSDDFLNESASTQEKSVNENVSAFVETQSSENAEVDNSQKLARKRKKSRGFFSKKEKEEQVKELENKVKELVETTQKQQEEINEWKDKFLRLFSEFDNFKKRNARERIELTRTASADIIRKLLPVLDDLERALKSAGDDPALAPYRQGVELILNKMFGILEKEGLKPIEAKGQLFDTDYHEALTNIPAPSEDLKGKVIDEVEKGYVLHDKVIRYAKVVVGS